MIKTFYDLDVYKRSYKVALDIQKLVNAFPKHEQFSLTSQICRGSRSIPANIAEGFSKSYSSAAEFKRFLSISVGSCNEMLVWLDFSKDLAYVDADTVLILKKEYEELGRMIYTLSQNWKKH